MIKLITLWTLVLTYSSSAQEYVLEWKKIYGIGYSNWANKIIETRAGNFVIVGVKRNAQGKHNSWMTKIDKIGNIIWEYSLETKRFDWANSIVETPNKDLIVIGTTNNTQDNNIIFLKLSAAGKLIQEKQIGTSKDKEGATHILMNDKNELIILAYKELNLGKRSIYLLKTDLNGNIIWKQEINNRFWNLGTTMSKNHQGQYIIGGHQYGNQPGKSDLIILAVDEQGKVIWRKLLERFGWNEIRSLYINDNDDILITGLTTDPVSRKLGILLINLDLRGEFKYHNIISYGKNSWGSSIVTNTAGFTALASTALSPHQSGEIFFTLLDPNLKELVNKRFGGMEWDESYNMLKTNGDDLILLCTGIDMQSKLQYAKIMKFKWMPKDNTALKAIDLEDLEHIDLEIGKVFTLDKIKFKKGSYALAAEAKNEIEKLSKLMLKYKRLRIELTGHTSVEGPHNKNMTLSRLRLEVVKNHLISFNIAEDRIDTQAFGETKPLCKGEHETCQAKNRRVELRILEY